MHHTIFDKFLIDLKNEIFRQRKSINVGRPDLTFVSIYPQYDNDKIA
jgi:hypothetical protein